MAPVKLIFLSPLLSGLRPGRRLGDVLWTAFMRTIRLNRCRRRRLIIRTDCRVARVGPTTPKQLVALEGAEHHALRRGSRNATPTSSTASAATIRAAGSGVSEAVAAVVPKSLITRLPPPVSPIGKG